MSQSYVVGDKVSCLRCKKVYEIIHDMYLCAECIEKKIHSCGIPQEDFMNPSDKSSL